MEGTPEPNTAPTTATDSDATDASAPRKTHVLLRILAVLVILVLAAVCVGAIGGASDNTNYPACSDTAAIAQSVDGKCFDNAKWQATAGLVGAIAAAAVLAAAGAVALIMLFSGRRAGLFVRLLGGGLLLLALSLLVTRI
ncbi:MAG: hypothetical protein QOJ38_1535 [Solirubrobacterales bacterium]|jgi:hypothetical protein|nr:hypothetical protein [Solirubrobacterales bacterium]